MKKNLLKWGTLILMLSVTIFTVKAHSAGFFDEYCSFQCPPGYIYDREIDACVPYLDEYDEVENKYEMFITNRKGEVVFACCSSKSNECSVTKFGYTLVVPNSRVVIDEI